MERQKAFDQIFEKAVGHAPYPYQVQLSTGDDSLPSLLELPTGAGKTAAVVFAWLWRRRFAEAMIRQATPRRLVYCLPMRVLVEQTRDCAVTWLNRLGLLGGKADFDEAGDLLTYGPFEGDDDPGHIRVHVVMGGDVDRDWDRYPERDAIIIGTQDMLLSRAFNRDPHPEYDPRYHGNG